MHGRFYLPDLAVEPGALAALSPDEAAHLTQVLRTRPGDVIGVFDGMGREFTARVESAGRGGVRIRLMDQVAARPEPRVRLTLAQAILKGEAFDRVVRDATMAGVSAIQPVLSAHGDVWPASASRGGRADRWRRIAISSAKQCGRSSLPAIAAPAALDAWLTHDESDLRLLLAEPAPRGAPAERVGSLRSRPAPASASLLIGPEGGWSEPEFALATRKGFVVLTLGSLTFRADAAALVAISALFTAWEAW